MNDVPAVYRKQIFDLIQIRRCVIKSSALELELNGCFAAYKNSLYRKQTNIMQNTLSSFCYLSDSEHYDLHNTSPCNCQLLS